MTPQEAAKVLCRGLLLRGMPPLSTEQARAFGVLMAWGEQEVLRVLAVPGIELGDLPRVDVKLKPRSERTALPGEDPDPPPPPPPAPATTATRARRNGSTRRSGNPTEIQAQCLLVLASGPLRARGVAAMLDIPNIKASNRLKSCIDNGWVVKGPDRHSPYRLTRRGEAAVGVCDESAEGD